MYIDYKETKKKKKKEVRGKKHLFYDIRLFRFNCMEIIAS